MITKHETRRLARRIARRNAGRGDRRIMHPARDWLIGLVGAALLLLGGSVGAGYLFWSKSDKATEASEATIDVVRYDQKLLQRVLTDYRGRRARYDSLRGEDAFVPEATSSATTTGKVSPVPESDEPVAE